MNKEIFSNKRKFYNTNIFIFTISALLVAVSFLIYKWNDISTYYAEKGKKEKYESLINSIQEIKTYNEMDLSDLNIPKITLETRWKDGLMYYKFHLINEISDKSLFPDKRKENRNFQTGVETIASIKIEFIDKDGFKIFSLPITISDMTRTIDENGDAIAYSINTSIEIKPELYKDFQNWELSYYKN